jgi:hypothetical protein
MKKSNIKPSRRLASKEEIVKERKLYPYIEFVLRNTYVEMEDRTLHDVLVASPGGTDRSSITMYRRECAHVLGLLTNKLRLGADKEESYIRL